MKKIILEFIFISLIIFILFKYNIVIKNNITDIFYNFLYNIIPSMFPIIFITYYVKYTILSKINNKYIYYLSLLFSFVPSNGLISKNKPLLYSSNINPLFSFYILKNILGIKISIIIIVVNLIINYILLYKNIDSIKIDSKSKDLTSIIKETTIAIINIFGVIIFFNILISILSVFINSNCLFFLEISNGFNIIKNINNYILRLLLSIFLNSFNGIAIFYQIKSINSDANYKYLFSKLILAIVITLITYLIILMFQHI